MPTVTTSEITKFYKTELPEADSKRIKSFLQDVAETLKDAKKNKVKTKFILEVSELIHEIRRHVLKKKKYPKAFELLYANLKGLAQELEDTAENEGFDRKYYTGVYELGMLLDDFARFIKFIVPIVFTLQDTGLFN